MAISMDGLGWRFASEHGFLQEELPYRGPLATTFGGSSSGVATLLTGTMPREHGHFAPYIYSPATSPFRSLSWMRSVPDFLAANGALRRWFSPWLRLHLGISADVQLYNMPLPLLPQMDYMDQCDLTEPGGIQGGQTTLFDDLREAGVRFGIYSGRDDAKNVEAARRGLESGGLQLVYLALHGLSDFLGAHGTRSSGVPRKLAVTEAQIRDFLYTAREHCDEVKVALFSTQGMVDVTGECNVARQVAALRLQLGRDYFVIYDATMARFWFLNQEAERTIVKALSGSLDGQWLSDHTLRQWGCDFAGGRYGHRIFLLRPGVLMNPSFMNCGHRGAMNGYDPWHKDSVAFFACNSPQMGRPAGLANLRDLLSASVGVFRLAARSA